MFGFDWYTFMIVDWTGSILLTILITMIIYLIILALGKIPKQIILSYLGITGVYFTSILYPSRAAFLSLITIAILWIVFESRKSIGREQ